MRLRFLHLAPLILAAPLVFASGAAAQRPDTLMPEQSIAKGKQILSDLTNALGGPGYLEARESQCEGRRVLFGHNGEPVGNIGFVNYRRYPDKDRTEFTKKRDVIYINNGDKGYEITFRGTHAQDPKELADFLRRRDCPAPRVVHRNIGMR